MGYPRVRVTVWEARGKGVPGSVVEVLQELAALADVALRIGAQALLLEEEVLLLRV